MNQHKTELISEFINKAVKVRRLIEQSGTIEDKAMTLLQMQALQYLNKNPGASVGNLADELLMSPSAVAQLTNRLADADLIVRKTHPSDRRIILLFPSKKGKQQIKNSSNQMLNANLSIFSSISEQDLKQMIRIFTNILESQSK